ncbi:MAG: rhodanese-like domain-containing protein, partial [Chloroflexota bacterium]
IFRFEGQVSVFDATRGPCYRCLFPEPPPPDTVPSCADAGVFGVLPGTIGTIQAAEVIKYFLGIGEMLVGKLLLYDALEMSFQTIHLRKNPRCKACGENPEISQLIDYDAFCGIQTVNPNQNFVGSDRDIDPPELFERLKRGEKIHLIDVRDPVEQQVSALPGAVVIPLERLGNKVKELDPQGEYILFCRTGVRSARGVRQMAAAGFQRVKNLRGGLNAWADQVDPDMLKY